MAWQCNRCNHWTADGKHHDCINDEVADLRADNVRLKGELEKMREHLIGLVAVVDGYFLEDTNHGKFVITQAREFLKGVK